MSTTADNYHENLSILKERTSVVNKRLKTENGEYKKLINRIIPNTCSSGAETVQPLNTNFKRISEIIEDHIGETHKFTDKVIDSLKNKEIYCFRDWISQFFTQVKLRYNAPNNDVRGWTRLMGAFNQKIACKKIDFRSQDEGYISQLKIILDEIQMSTYDFELLYKMKKESNVEFHDQANILAEAEERFEMMQFSDKIKHYEEPLKKLFEGLKVVS